MAKRDPFPLQWPENAKRTPTGKRERSRFGIRGQVSFSQSRRELLDELSRLGAANAVITSDLPTRHDGLPYATNVTRDIDSGIAVWFVLPDDHGNLQERVFACDRWVSHAENMRGLALTIAAIRGIDRWGVADAAARAFAGFAALPPGSSGTVPPGPVKRSWREIFGMTAFETLAPPDLLAIARSRHRERIKVAHPDAGGSHEAAAEINAALAEAEQELAP